MARRANSQTLGMALEGDKELHAAIARILKETDDLRPAWDQFYRPGFHKAMEQTFSTKQSGTWKPLKGYYAAWKMAHGGGSMMVLTQDLKQSLTGTTGESVFEADARKMLIGSTNMPTNTPRGRMLIWANSTSMKHQMRLAAQKHADWYAEKWSHR